MVVSACALECQENRFRHGTARQHEPLAQLKILKPPLVRHHSVSTRVEVRHIAPVFRMAVMSLAP
jgi:hypothetical protein